MEPKSNTSVEGILFTERVKPPLWLLAFIFFLLASVALSIWAAFDNPAGTLTLAIAVILLFVFRRSLVMTIELSRDEMRVGSAHIERIYVGEATELSIEQMRQIRTRDADPAAYLAIRFWEPRGVKVMINDPRDPTPYWLISSKNAKGLAEVLNKR